MHSRSDLLIADVEKVFAYLETIKDFSMDRSVVQLRGRHLLKQHFNFDILWFDVTLVSLAGATWFAAGSSYIRVVLIRPALIAILPRRCYR